MCNKQNDNQTNPTSVVPVRRDTEEFAELQADNARMANEATAEANRTEAEANNLRNQTKQVTDELTELRADHAQMVNDNKAQAAQAD